MTSTGSRTRASRRIWLAITAAAIAVAAGAGGLAIRGLSGANAQPAGQVVLKIGDQRGGIRALMTAADVLRDTPYKVQWAEMPAAAPLLEALSAGAIDMGGVGGAPFAFAYSNGAPIKAVIATRYLTVDPETGKSSAILVAKASPLHTVADLRGRRLATIKGSAGQDVALRILDRAGIDPKDVHFVYLNNGDAKAALGAGSIDAWSTWGTYVGIAVAEGGNRVLADATGLISPGRIAGLQAASAKALSQKGPQLRDFLQRYVRARAWARDHREDYARSIAKETGVPLSAARYGAAAVTGTEFTPIDANFLDEQRKTFDLYRRAGLIDTIPPLDKTGYDPVFNELIKTKTTQQAAR
jgi:sulfonate transport system substrate-binding protein